MRPIVPFLAFALMAAPGMAVTGFAQAPPPAPADVAPAPAPAVRKPARPRPSFETANTTHDGRLTLKQAQTARWARVVRNFQAIDTGGKGYITRAELRTYFRDQRAQRPAAPRPAPPPAAAP